MSSIALRLATSSISSISTSPAGTGRRSTWPIRRSPWAQCCWSQTAFARVPGGRGRRDERSRRFPPVARLLIHRGQLMEVLLANPRGFCAGVERAISIVERALALHGAPIYVRHEVVHNKFVVDDLRRQGAVFIEK